MSVADLRIGHGYDVHRFAEHYDEQQPLVLAGVTFEEERTLEAHSDGDLVLHALCDAILGAMACGDIGQHFPDNDPQFSGADSTDLLQQVLALAASKTYRLINVDITVVAQVPKLSPHRSAMNERLQSLLGLPPDCVNLKATTTEKLGDIGAEKGMGCHAVVLMQANA